MPPQCKAYLSSTPGVLLAVFHLAARGLDVVAVGRTVVGAPRRLARLLAGVAVDGLAVAPGHGAVTIEHVLHPFQRVFRAEPAI